tara:strand:- start:1161 stop:1607 length:447 start_codon:yes stop_codon:yes gene_type:complete
MGLSLLLSEVSLRGCNLRGFGSNLLTGFGELSTGSLKPVLSSIAGVDNASMGVMGLSFLTKCSGALAGLICLDLSEISGVDNGLIAMDLSETDRADTGLIGSTGLIGFGGGGGSMIEILGISSMTCLIFMNTGSSMSLIEKRKDGEKK